MHNIVVRSKSSFSATSLSLLTLALPPQFQEGFSKWLGRGRRPGRIFVPPWGATPYGQLSQGLFWEAQRSRVAHTRLARLWGVFHYVLGIIGIALAALAGFGGLSKLFGYQQVAFIAIGSGIATGLITFLKSEEKSQQHDELAAAWDNLGDDVTKLYMTQPGIEEVLGRAVLQDGGDQRNLIQKGGRP